MLEVKGSVERITFQNPENAFVIFKVKSGSELHTVVGVCPDLHKGQSVTVVGTLIEDKKWGRQIKAQKIVPESPKSKEGIIKFLSSGSIPGIGEGYAKKIVDKFGLEALDVIRDEPAKLKAIAGLGSKTVAKASRALKEQGVLADLMSFLQSCGLGVSKAKNLLAVYGLETVDILRKNPYRLVEEIDGIGFHTADELALQLGIGAHSRERQIAAMQYVLKKASSDGHLFLPQEALVAETAKLLGIEVAYLESDSFVVEEERVYLNYYHRLESDLADLLKAFLSFGGTIKEVNLDLLAKIQSNESLKLSEEQLKAVVMALSNKASVITGGPGTGKSTLTRILVKVAAASGKRIALCSPTGRAAQRLEEICGREASTIHRLLKYDPQTKSFSFNEDKPLEVDLLLCDESSMLDLPLLRSLFKAIPHEAQIVFVGDKDQLPPVGVGTFFTDLMESSLVEVAALSQVFRQSKESGIVHVAHKINSGDASISSTVGEDFYFIEEEDMHLLQEKVLELVSTRIPNKFGFKNYEIQVLSPMYRGQLGIDNLNSIIQKAVNPDPSLKFSKGEQNWGLGDRVVVLKNDYEKEVFNGDLGSLSKIDQLSAELTVSFDKGRTVVFDFDEADKLKLAYCLSIHKSQGSEFPCVVLPMTTQHFRMLRRKLLYTALTRAKKLCIIIGSKKAFQIAVKNFQEQPRYSHLKQRLLSS
jgi:exodeoxyribonuclease V alpha subunit